MTKKTIHRTTVTLTVFSEKEPGEIKDIRDVLYQWEDGCLPGKFESNTIPVTGKRAVTEIEKIGYEPDVFGMDAEGNELERNDEDIIRIDMDEFNPNRDEY
jgi:hypothetical protein